MKQQLTKRFTRSQLDNNNNHQVNNTKVVSKSNRRRQNSHKSNKVKGSAPCSKLKGRVKTRSQIANSNNQPLIESRQDEEDEELKDNKMSSIPSTSNNTASSATNNNSDTKRANETLTSLKPPPSNTTLSQQPKQKEETPEQIAFRKSYPLTNISEPTNNDCLFGRGGGTNHHPGNKHYRSIVDSQKQRYLNSKRLDKPMVAMEIITNWRAQYPPGRFLKLDETTKLWNDVGDKKAREKTSQALREKTPVKQRDVNDPRNVNRFNNNSRFNNGAGGVNRGGSGHRAHFQPGIQSPQLSNRKPMLSRDHSLGTEIVYGEHHEISLEGFSWDDNGDGMTGGGVVVESSKTTTYQGGQPQFQQQHGAPSNGHYPPPNHYYNQGDQQQYYQHPPPPPDQQQPPHQHQFHPTDNQQQQQYPYVSHPSQHSSQHSNSHPPNSHHPNNAPPPQFQRPPRHSYPPSNYGHPPPPPPPPPHGQQYYSPQQGQYYQNGAPPPLPPPTSQPQGQSSPGHRAREHSLQMNPLSNASTAQPANESTFLLNERQGSSDMSIKRASSDVSHVSSGVYNQKGSVGGTERPTPLELQRQLSPTVHQYNPNAPAGPPQPPIPPPPPHHGPGSPYYGYPSQHPSQHVRQNSGQWPTPPNPHHHQQHHHTPTPQFTYGGPNSSGSAFGQYSDSEKDRKDSLYSLGSSVGQYYDKQAQREHIPAPQGGSNASSTTIPSPRTSSGNIGGKGGKHASKGKRIITENPASAGTSDDYSKIADLICRDTSDKSSDSRERSSSMDVTKDVQQDDGIPRSNSMPVDAGRGSSAAAAGGGGVASLGSGDKPSLIRKLSGGAMAGANNATPPEGIMRPQPVTTTTTATSSRPEMVKRDTSNQPETLETKRSIKRVVLSRDKSAISKSLKEEQQAKQQQQQRPLLSKSKLTKAEMLDRKMSVEMEGLGLSRESSIHNPALGSRMTTEDIYKAVDNQPSLERYTTEAFLETLIDTPEASGGEDGGATSPIEGKDAPPMKDAARSLVTSPTLAPPPIVQERVTTIDAIALDITTGVEPSGDDLFIGDDTLGIVHENDTVNADIAEKWLKGETS